MSEPTVRDIEWHTNRGLDGWVCAEDQFLFHVALPEWAQEVTDEHNGYLVLKRALAEREERIKQLAKAVQALLGNISGKATQGRFIVQSLDVMALQIALSQLNEQEPPAQSGQEQTNG